MIGVEVVAVDAGAPGYKGFRDYTSSFLKVYDRFVLGFMAPRVWRVTAEPSVAQYRDHLGARHLDVGPGTGFAIVEADPPPDVELTLMDPNPAVLEHCADTLAPWSPSLVEANVLEPLPTAGPFDSAALSHVLHCLPGPMASKSKAVEHVASVLAADGVLFGGTVLGLSADHTMAGRLFLRAVNRHGSFGNLNDDIDGLRAILEASFQDVQITMPSGSIAYFVASGPTGASAPGSTDSG